MTHLANKSSASWPIVHRNITLDWSKVPLNWIYKDRFASHAISGLSYYLISGEFAMCRICNEARPYISDPKLREDVTNFIKQEATHARAHGKHLSEYMERHGITGALTNRVSKQVLERIFTKRPFGMTLPKPLHKPWFMVSAGIFAAFEHYTTGLGVYLLNELKWQQNGCSEPMAELLYWHACEEIEHRTVMYDVFYALGGNYPLRVVLMAGVMPVMLAAMVASIADINHLDDEVEKHRKMPWRLGFWRDWQASAKRKNVPSPWWVISHAFSFMQPSYHPVNEGSTEEALAILAQLSDVAAVAS